MNEDNKEQPSERDIRNYSNKDLKIAQLEEQVASLQLRIEEITKSYKSEIEDLKNNLIDKDFENGIFVEKEIFNKLDQENMELRRLLDDFYKKELQDWYSEVTAKIKEL